MPFAHGTQSRVWLDGKSADCTINEINMEREIEEAEVTTLCSTIKDYIPGLSEVTVEFEGFFDTNTVSPALSLDGWMHDRMGVTFPFVYAPEGGAQVGDPAYFMNGFLQTYSVESTVDEAVSMEAEFRATGGLSRGLIIQPLTTQIATDADGLTSLDNTVLTSNGGSAVLSVAAASGTLPTLAVFVEHSVDGISWATLGSFASQTDVNAEIITFSGTVNRHLRAVWTIGGTLPSFTFNVAVHRN